MIALRPNHSLNARRDGRSGFTLAEAMVASAIAVFIMAGVLTTYVMSVRSFQSLANYWTIHSGGRLIIEYFSADMRGVSSITSLSATNIQCVVPTAFNSSGVAITNKTVNYFLRSGSFYRTDSTVTNTTLISQNISTLTFSLFDKFGSSTSITTNAKAIQLDLRLLKMVGSKTNSEDYLSAKLVMRNTP